MDPVTSGTPGEGPCRCGNGAQAHTEQQRLTALAVRQVRRSRTTPGAANALAVYQSTAALLAVEHGSNALAEQRIPVAGAKVVSTAFTLTPAAPSVLDDVDSGFQFDRIVASLVTDAGAQPWASSRRHGPRGRPHPHRHPAIVPAVRSSRAAGTAGPTTSSGIPAATAR